MEPVLTPRQERSQRTQEKLLEALEALLQTRVFEQITIQDIAGEAGVAVGTIYRRFRNKEALLPVLYRRLDGKMDDWAATVWRDRVETATDEDPLLATLRRLVAAHVRFYRRNAPLLRTLYLQVRLNGELAGRAVARRRRILYERLLAPVLECLAQTGRDAPRDDQVRCFVLLLLSPVMERCLFPDNTPASTLRMSDRRFVEELTRALYRYLTDGRT